MRLVFVGNTNVAWICLKYLLEARKNIVGIFMPKGVIAFRQAGFKSLEDLAEKYNAPLFPIENINSTENITTWRNLKPDLGIIVGWSQIIKKEILTIPRMGCLGFHAALLPWGRGGAPVNWSIINGDKEIGTTLFHIDEGVDSGDIIDKKKISIELKDTCKTVFDKLAWTNVNLLMKNFPGIESENYPRKQQQWEKATYRPTRRPEDGLIDWDRVPLDLYNWVRALTHPYPGAFTFYKRKKIIIWEIKIPAEKTEEGRQGEVIGVNKDDGLQIGCNGGSITVSRIQFEGEAKMWGEDFFKNYKLKRGITLGKPDDFPPYIHIDLLGRTGRDYRYETNLNIGETGKSIIRIMNYERDSLSLLVTVNFNEKTILDKRLEIDFGESKEIEIKYTGEQSGISKLDIIIIRNEKIYKKKQLLVFVHP